MTLNDIVRQVKKTIDGTKPKETDSNRIDTEDDISNEYNDDFILAYFDITFFDITKAHITENK